MSDPNDLIDLTTIKSWLNINDSSQDAILSMVITAASSAISNYIGRNLKSAAHTESYDGTGTDRLCPVNFPITAVSSLSVDGKPIPISTGNQGYIFGDNVVSLLGGIVFARGRQNVAITYTAGGSAISPDIKQAALMTIQAMISVQTIDPTVSSESATGGYRVTYRETAGAIPAGAQALLRPYRRVTW